MKTFTAFLAGLLFGIGLILSGMTDPSKVVGFLDVAGAWDPSLAFVMGGALLVTVLLFPLATRGSTILLGAPPGFPKAKPVDRRLVLGSLTFGVGWGLAGYCPGPAVASLARGGVAPIVFTVAMLAGMGMFEVLTRRQGRG